jgi:hypothetical protein
MRSSSLGVAFAVAFFAARAGAQEQPQGFAVERLYLSPAGGGWFVMDALDMAGGLGGAAAFTMGVAHNPLQLRSNDGSQHLAVVSSQAFANFGFAATYDRFRLYVDVSMPLTIQGESGMVGDYQFAGPSVDVAANPDTLSDARLGFDARLLGDATSPFRLGAGVQLLAPSGNRSDYDTDGTYRAMGRLLFAGERGLFTYAGHLGIHIRPLDDSPAPGGPRGSELLFGVAAGPRLMLDSCGATGLVVGPEVYGASAFGSLFATTATALEALLTGRLEIQGEGMPMLRVKAGAGGGMNPHFGAPAWRAVLGIEVLNHK